LFRNTVSHKTSRVLLEIRLRWSDKVRPEEPGGVGGLWLPDTPFNRDKLKHAVEVGSRLYGHETHWIEERQA
jgi:hypothetical protein